MRLPTALEYRDGALWMEGVALAGLARRHGTPLYVYSAAAVLERLARLRSAFREREPLICYALKANSNRAVCGLLARDGAGADVVSGGELRRALAAGFAPGRVVFSGVGKTEDEFRLALRSRILCLNVESGEELDALGRAAARLRRPAPFAVRLNPGVDAGTHAHITTGLAENKFGVERREALSLYRRGARHRWLKPLGVQCHLGSQITRIEPYRRALKEVLRLVEDAARAGIRLAQVDLGGGMGVPYRDEPPFPVSEFAGALVAGLGPRPDLRLLLEPGRFLVAESGVLLTRVLYRKRTSERRFVVVDAAMNDLARPALYDAYHPILPVRRTGRRRVVVDVVGPVCETADYLARGRSLAEPSPGELLAVLCAGAYGFSMSSQYNSRPRAAEVLVSRRRCRVVRRRETVDDLVRHES